MRLSRLACVVLAVCALAVAGCSTAGPFITNVSSDGKGGLVIEKAMVSYNGLLGTLSTKDHTTSTIQVAPTPAAKE
jgi:type IV secretion system protein VirB7